MYNFNFTHIINSLLPPKLNKQALNDFLCCILNTITAIKDSFTSYRALSYRSISTCQVMYLEMFLNDYYQQQVPELIYIEDIVTDDQIYVGLNTEVIEQYLYNAAETDLNDPSYDIEAEPVYIINISEAPTPGFIVQVYNDLYNDLTASGDMETMHKLIKKHKAAGKNYQILSYPIL